MDPIAMARPPPKRRKLSNYERDTPWADYRAGGDRSQAVARAAKPLEEAERLSQAAVGGIEGHRVLLPRQGTADTATPPATTPTPTPTPAGPSSTSSSGLDLNLSLSLSASISLPDIPGIVTGLPDSLTGLPESAISGILSDVSGALAPSETPASNTSASSDATTTPTTSDLPSDTSVPATSSGNVTSAISSTPETIESTTSSVAPSSTSAGFLTSSFSGNATIPVAISSTSSSADTQTSSASTESSSLSSSSTDSALLFVATLSEGDVTTLLRSGDAFTTTFDGNTFTVSGAPTTFASETSSSSQSTASLSLFSDSSSNSGQQTLTSTATAGVGTSSAYPTSTEPASNSGSGNSSDTPPAGTIAGGVVGGAAGLAVVVLIAMLAVRWYRRKGMAQHHALPQGPVNLPDSSGPSSGGPGMAERAGLMPLAAAVPAFFRHHSRSEGGQENTERGFTRVSGRKLPSAFSGGLSIQPPPNTSAHHEAYSDFNGDSSYRDSSGLYGGDGSPPSPTGSVPLRSNSYERMTLSPGPQRTPTLHAGGPYNMSPGSAGPYSPPANLTRSDAPFMLDPNRNSRFSEGL